MAGETYTMVPSAFFVKPHRNRQDSINKHFKMSGLCSIQKHSELESACSVLA